jgi:hypothetical protein
LPADFAAGSRDFGDGFGACPGVALAALFVALVDHYAVEDVDTDGGEAEGLGREVEGANGAGGFEIHNVYVEAVGERDGEFGFLCGGEVVKNFFCDIIFFCVIVFVLFVVDRFNIVVAG